VNTDEERILFEIAHFEAGRCYMNMGKPKDAIELFSGVITNFPGSDRVKDAMYHIGLIFESVKQRDKAITYFNKVLNMQPADELSRKAMDRIKKLQG
jgi:TolA-binding protein